MTQNDLKKRISAEVKASAKVSQFDPSAILEILIPLVADALQSLFSKCLDKPATASVNMFSPQPEHRRKLRLAVVKRLKATGQTATAAAIDHAVDAALRVGIKSQAAERKEFLDLVRRYEGV